MDILASNNFFEISVIDDVATLDIKEKVFELITNINLSTELLGLLSEIDRNQKIKALVFFNSPDSLNDENYDLFIKSIVASDDKCDGGERPCFSQKNTRFREINILNNLIRAIASLQTLVISGIQGTVVTPFIGASMVADFRFASENAILSMIHNKYGLHPSGGLPFFLSSFLDHSKALEIQMSDRISAKEALDLGLVSKLLPDESFREHLLKEIKPFTRLNYCSIRDTKRLTNFNRQNLTNYFDFEANLLNL